MTGKPTPNECMHMLMLQGVLLGEAGVGSLTCQGMEPSILQARCPFCSRYDCSRSSTFVI